jgi:hypothetical protein
MRFWFVALFANGLLLAGVAGHAAENELRASKPDTRREVLAAIDGQLGAFRQGDVSRAYGYAASELRAQHPLRSFAAIVETNYPEVWASTRAEYGIVRDDGRRATVLVHVFGPHSDAAYDYTLVRERGAWRVHDVLRHDKADRV